MFRPGRGLKIDDILKDDEVLTAFLLRDAGLSESIVYQLVNAEIRLEQVQFGGMRNGFFQNNVEELTCFTCALKSILRGHCNDI